MTCQSSGSRSAVSSCPGMSRGCDEIADNKAASLGVKKRMNRAGLSRQDRSAMFMRFFFSSYIRLSPFVPVRPAVLPVIHPVLTCLPIVVVLRNDSDQDKGNYYDAKQIKPFPSIMATMTRIAASIITIDMMSAPPYLHKQYTVPDRCRASEVVFALEKIVRVIAAKRAPVAYA